jgi:hypothetical protein
LKGIGKKYRIINIETHTEWEQLMSYISEGKFKHGGGHAVILRYLLNKKDIKSHPKKER